MSSPTESAEGEQAVYTIADKQMVMTGDVAVTQGSNIVTGQRMVVNLDDGTAVMEGRVRTIIDTSKPAKTPTKTPANASAGGVSGGAQ
jgi:lipopolysaccharide export system protein LptA